VEDGDSHHCLLVSETADRVLRVYFIGSRHPILWARIAHEESVGALAAITRALHGAGFNLLTSLARLQHHGTCAEFEVVMRPGGGVPREPERLREALERALCCDEVARFNVRVGYPERYGREVEMKDVALLRASLPAAPDRGACGAPAAAVSRRGRAAADRVAADPWDAPAGKPRLFISYAFQDEPRMEPLLRRARKSFRVVTGTELEHGQLRDQIVKVIDGCDAFLGIWTPAGGVKVAAEEKYWPSPWLHWEFGVAEAKAKIWHLLISSEVSSPAWSRLAAETHHTAFTQTNLDAQFRKALNVLEAVCGRRVRVAPPGRDIAFH
jgi:hypothetical protein